VARQGSWQASCSEESNSEARIAEACQQATKFGSLSQGTRPCVAMALQYVSCSHWGLLQSLSTITVNIINQLKHINWHIGVVFIIQVVVVVISVLNIYNIIVAMFLSTVVHITIVISIVNILVAVAL
jgi:hypothetical protein